MQNQATPVSLDGAEPRVGLFAALAPVSALLLSIAILLTGNGLQGTLVPVRANLEHFSALDLGILGASYFAGFTLGCVLGPAMIARGGHIRTYLAMVSLASVIALLHVIVIDPILWWVLRVVTGLSFAVLYIVIESWLNERATNATRGTVFSAYTFINLTVITIGQMMLTLADPKAFTLFALSSILVSLAALPVAFTTATSPAPVPLVWPRMGKLFGISPVGVYGCLAVGFANGSFWAIGPIFAQDIGFDLTGVGLFMSAAVLGGALGQWPLGILSDRMDRRLVMLFAAVVAGASAIALMMIDAGPGQMTATLLFAALFGFGAFPIYPLSVAHANDHADAADCVEVSSGLLLVFGVAAAIGPILVGILRDMHPDPALFYFTGIVHLVLIAAIIWRISQRSAPAADERVDFATSSIAAQTLAAFDPLPEEVEAESGRHSGG